MVIKEQSGLRAVLKDIPIPPVYVVRQNVPQDGIPDVSACLREKLDREELRSRIRPGMRVVLTAGSRQIAHMPEILQELARFLKGQGAKPYIIPTTGSHGGATAEGQRNILESYGITEEFCECPIFSSMETVEVGKMPDGDPVRMDRFAFESDAVVVVGRIKGHTAFRGPYESGLVKMIAVGLGKREGADLLHQKGFRVFGERLPQYARVIYDHCNILFGVGIIENEHDETCRIEVLPSEKIFDKEPALLTYAKSRMPRLLFPETDLLLVREIGKNFSGNGMDPNVTGTFGTPYGHGGRHHKAGLWEVGHQHNLFQHDHHQGAGGGEDSRGHGGRPAGDSDRAENSGRCGSKAFPPRVSEKYPFPSDNHDFRSTFGQGKKL